MSEILSNAFKEVKERIGERNLKEANKLQETIDTCTSLYLRPDQSRFKTTLPWSNKEGMDSSATCSVWVNQRTEGPCTKERQIGVSFIKVLGKHMIEHMDIIFALVSKGDPKPVSAEYMSINGKESKIDIAQPEEAAIRFLNSLGITEAPRDGYLVDVPTSNPEYKDSA